MGSLKDLKEKVWKCNLELQQRHLVVYTFGNASGIDWEHGVMAIKPSGIPYEELKASDMVLVDLDYKVVEGNYRPSSDTKTHVVLYRNFPRIAGVVHTHSPYATAWAQARKPIPCLGTTHADHVYGEVPCTAELSDEQIGRDYEEETGVQIVRHFKQEKRSYEDTEMVLVANHGPFTWGKSPEKAVYSSVILEELAKMALFTTQVAPRVKPIRQSLLDKHYYRKHGAKAYYGQK